MTKHSGLEYGLEIAIVHEAELSALCNQVPVQVHLCIKMCSHGYRCFSAISRIDSETGRFAAPVVTPKNWNCVLLLYHRRQRPKLSGVINEQVLEYRMCHRLAIESGLQCHFATYITLFNLLHT